MDMVALRVLETGLPEDARHVANAAARAGDRLEEAPSAASLPACGYELNRAYNILEKAFERVCDAFENHFEKRGGFHERLLERMRLDIPGVRPAFVPATAQSALRELKGFRHVFRHAYDLDLRRDRLEELVRHATAVARDFPGWIGAFCAAVRADMPGP